MKGKERKFIEKGIIPSHTPPPRHVRQMIELVGLRGGRDHLPTYTKSSSIPKEKHMNVQRDEEIPYQEKEDESHLCARDDGEVDGL